MPKKRKVPKTLHCSRCKYVTHSGISALAKHYRKEHPSAMKKKSKTISKKSNNSPKKRSTGKSIKEQIINLIRKL